MTHGNEQLEVEKLYMIAKCKDGNYHQCILEDELIPVALIPVEGLYPNNSFTKECSEAIVKLADNLRGLS